MPLLWLSIAFIIGIFIESILHWSMVAWVSSAIVFLVISLLEPILIQKYHPLQKIRNIIPLHPGILLLVFSLGAIRLMTSTPVLNDSQLAWYNDKGEFNIVAWVSAPPDVYEDKVIYQLSSLEIEELSDPDWVDAVKRVNGKLQVVTYYDSAWQYGDLMRFTGKPVTPKDSQDFSYKDYLSRHGILTVVDSLQNVSTVGSGMGNPVRKALINLRSLAHKTIFSLFPQPESSLLAGMVLGLDNDLPKSLANAFRTTGTSHIIAISGFNMAVIAGLFISIFTRVFNRYWAALLATAVIITYTFFVDGSASVVRAAIMSIIAFGGQLIGRRRTGLNALGFTAAIMCLINPLLLWDLSFQFSFMATFGLVFFAQPMQFWLEEKLKKRLPEDKVYKVSAPLSEYFLFTLAAQVTTLPVLAWHFKQLSPVSIIANPLVLPAQPVVLILGLITTIAGMISPFVGRALAVIEWPLLAFTNRTVQFLARTKGATLTLHPIIAIWILIAFVLLILVFVFRNYFKKLLGGRVLVWLILALACGSFTVWSIYSHRPDDQLHLTILRNGESASLYLKTPAGQNILIDPIGEMDELAAALTSDLSPWDFHLDTILLTNPRSMGNVIDLNSNIPIRKIVLSPSIYLSSQASPSVVFSHEIPLEKLDVGAILQIESNVSIRLITVPSNDSAVEIIYKELHILIPNGVDYARIKQVSPESMVNLTALVLSPLDISYIPPRVWQQLDPALILWNSQTLSPFHNSYGLDVFNRVSLVTDGITFRVTEK